MRAHARRALLGRAARRTRDRGAVIFIVAMTLALLAAMGIYAMTSARSETQTAGFERQNTQAHYLAEYGILGAANVVNADTMQLYLALMTDTTRRDKNCVSLTGVPSTATTSALACRRMGANELAKMWPSAASSQALPASAFGSALPVRGDFFLELTDPVYAQPPPGQALGLGLCYAKVTASALGLSQNNANPSTQALSFYGNEGLEMARARITAGPIRCAQ